MLNYLRSSNLEVGLLIHFGPKGVDKVRMVASNRRKPVSNVCDLR